MRTIILAALAAAPALAEPKFLACNGAETTVFLDVSGDTVHRVEMLERGPTSSYRLVVTPMAGGDGMVRYTRLANVMMAGGQLLKIDDGEWRVTAIAGTVCPDGGCDVGPLGLDRLQALHDQAMAASAEMASCTPVG